MVEIKMVEPIKFVADSLMDNIVNNLDSRLITDKNNARKIYRIKWKGHYLWFKKKTVWLSRGGALNALHIHSKKIFRLVLGDKNCLDSRRQILKELERRGLLEFEIIL